MQPIRVLLVEDHLYTAQGLQHVLSKFGTIEFLGCANKATEGLAMAAKLKPDIVLLDVHLPGGPPASELLEAYCRDQPWKVIVLSSEQRLAFIETALLMGAVAFLSKSEPPARLIATIEKAHQNSNFTVVSQDLTHDVFRLSPGYEQLLKLVGKGLKYQEIAEIRGGTAEGIRKQCERIQMKLRLTSREQLIAWAVEHGYTAVD